MDECLCSKEAQLTRNSSHCICVAATLTTRDRAPLSNTALLALAVPLLLALRPSFIHIRFASSTFDLNPKS